MSNSLKSVSNWKSEEIFRSGDVFFKRLIGELSHAKDCIDLETYIYEDDELGRRITATLSQAAARGVKVRVMADGIGSPHWCANFVPKLLKNKVQARIFHPAPWVLLLEPLRKHVSLSHFMKLLSFINRRNHRKICVIDKKTAWLGSMNIHSVHLKSQNGNKAWHDIGVRVVGPGVQDLSQAFNKAWNEAWDYRHPTLIHKHKHSKKKISTNRLVRINNNWNSRRRLYKDLLTRIGNAKNKIWLISAYFVPSAAVVRALCRAARKGIDVRIIVPRNSDVFFIHSVTSAYYYGLLKAGVRIFEYLPSVLHAKMLMIDNWVVVGSSNMNHRSLIHDLEADIVMTKPAARHELESYFRSDLRKTHEITFKDWEKQPVFERIASKTLSMLKYWM
ncbi:MAG: phosphatidylserine/phosphatidylglycerophosphate/cardiolipin synthase family protein [Oligoflexia bacterium]|nr:phosphatidylserine/phosphatidylglycerophosphate/cardiolipin synthase family protein [Oligoflexia bacterium]